MSYNTLYLFMITAAVMWAVSGLLIIIRYLQADYLWVGINIGLMVMNAFNYTLMKSKLG